MKIRIHGRMLLLIISFAGSVSAAEDIVHVSFNATLNIGLLSNDATTWDGNRYSVRGQPWAIVGHPDGTRSYVVGSPLQGTSAG